MLFKERTMKLSDLLDRSRFCFYDNYSYNPDTQEVLSRKLTREIRVLAEGLSQIENFNKEAIEVEFRKIADSLGLKAKDLVHPTRVALTGNKVGPGLFETMQVLGKDKVIARLNRLINYWGG
jgi:glutamyl/glutaminyl-tRNA synthetase